MRRGLVLVVLVGLMAGCFAPPPEDAVPTDDAPDVPEPCMVWRFEWQDDDTWPQVVRAYPQPSQGIWPETSLHHPIRPIDKAWVNFGYWRDREAGRNIEVDSSPDDPHLTYIGLVGDWDAAEDVPPEVQKIVGSWVRGEGFAERLWKEYVQNREVNSKGNMAAWLAVHDTDFDVGAYWSDLWRDRPYPPEHPFYHAPGRFHLATPEGNWSVGIPMREIAGNGWYFYADAWWNAGLQVQQDAFIPDAWAFLYAWGNATGIHIPTSMRPVGPVLCGADPHVRVGSSLGDDDRVDPPAPCSVYGFHWNEPRLWEALQGNHTEPGQVGDAVRHPHLGDVVLSSAASPHDWDIMGPAVGVAVADGQTVVGLRGAFTPGPEMPRDLREPLERLAPGAGDAVWKAYLRDNPGGDWNVTSIPYEGNLRWAQAFVDDVEERPSEPEFFGDGTYRVEGGAYQWTFHIPIAEASGPGIEVRVDAWGHVSARVEYGTASPSGASNPRHALDAFLSEVATAPQKTPLVHVRTVVHEACRGDGIG